MDIKSHSYIWSVCLCFYVWVLGSLVASEISATERDSLIFRAEQQMRSRAFEEAVDIFQRLVETFPEDARLLTRLGYAYLKKGDLRAARQAFEAAKKCDNGLPDAYVGLGLSYVKRPARGMEAYYNFRRAIGEGKKAIDIDAVYGPAYRLIGEAYERFEEDHEKAIEYFVKYIELEPDNPDGLYEFGLACIQAGQFDKVDTYIAPFVEKYPQETQLIPLSAQAHFFFERYERAREYFERYLQTLDEAERELYTDISLIASQEELEDYRAAPEAKAYLERFWIRRDSDILTEINERVIEHCRRVWYARTFFANGVHPWDKRGEVYIRYGEPDYRSRSTKRQFVKNSKVQAVRDQMAVALYGPEAALLTFTGPVFPVRASRNPFAASLIDRDEEVPVEEALEDEDASEASAAASGVQDPLGAVRTDSRFDEFGNLKTQLNFGGYAPITMGDEGGTVPWETWTYTQVGNGIEITFTDEASNGRFDFAPIPPPSPDGDVSKLSRFTKYAPGVVFQNAVDRVPDVYHPSFQHPPLDFYFDLADFRATDGRTMLEVYYGLPVAQVAMARKKGVPYIQVKCALALADADYTTIHRAASRRAYRVAGDFTRSQRAFMPELLKLQVPPGKYDLQVQIRDLISGHTGIYRQAVEVKDYPKDRLRISDIQLAAAIEDRGPHNRFKKGEVWVVPMPTRNYKGAQKVYAYYEIYNLEKNAFGQTHFKVQYLVRSVSKPIRGALGSVATGLRSLLGGKNPQVSIGYEHAGLEPNEQGYVEIDLTEVKRGVNILEVKIEDLVVGKRETREIRFQYGE